MKALFINPPTWFNMFPPLALPILAGYLKTLNHKTQIIDLNIEFYHFIFSDKFIRKFISLFSSLEKEVSMYSMDYKADGIKDKDEKIKIYSEIIQYARKTGYDIYKTREYCKEYKRITKDKNRYFNSWEVKIYHHKVLIYSELLLKLQNIYKNLFQEFFSKWIDKVLRVDADFIGLSMSDVDQFFYSIKIAKLLKKRTKVPICFGGTCINYFYDKKISDKLKFHKQVADFVIFGSGEFPISDIADYIEGKIKISQIRNVEYVDENGNLQRNKSKLKGIIPKYITKYDDFDFRKYFTPIMVLSVETTKGCYWHKCSFCTRPTLHDGFLFRKPEDVADELEILSKKYNVKYFHLMDDCIPTKYAEKLASIIIEKQLDINYMTFLRFEEDMSEDFLKLLYDSGLRLVIWGLESTNDERLNYINKGLNIKTAKKILQIASKIGIKNNITLIVDFPNETESELQCTLDFIHNYSDYIYFAHIHQFQLLENTMMFNHPEKYNISKAFVQKTIRTGYAKNTDTDKYENIIEETNIKSMMKGAPPGCLFTTGGSLLYAIRNNII